MVGAFVVYGSPDTVAELAHAHLAARADHVTLPRPAWTPFGPGVDHLLDLAPALT